jgi:hypothetical protein
MAFSQCGQLSGLIPRVPIYLNRMRQNWQERRVLAIPALLHPPLPPRNSLVLRPTSIAVLFALPFNPSHDQWNLKEMGPVNLTQ